MFGPLAYLRPLRQRGRVHCALDAPGGRGHGPTRARRAWAAASIAATTLTEKYAASHPRALAAERRFKQLPTYLARPGGPKVELPTYVPLYSRYIELRSLRKDQTLHTAGTTFTFSRP